MTAVTTRAAPATGTPGVGRDTALALRDDIRMRTEGDSVHLTGPALTLTLRPVPADVRDALERLAAGPVRRPELFGPLPIGRHRILTQVLHRVGHLTAKVLLVDGRERLRLEPTARDSAYEPVPVDPDLPVRLSRFAFLRSRDGRMVLESPLAKFRVPLNDQAVRDLIATLGGPRTPATLARDALPLPVILAVLADLAGAGFVETAAGDGTFRSDSDETLHQWDFHDLLFHSRVRSGRYDDVFGAVYPHRGRIAPQPAVKPPPDGESIALFRPRLDDLLAKDPALTTAVETRRSIREYGERPLTVDQLGEFLYRVGRVRAHVEPGDGVNEGTVSRPYPSGGGAYDLELYVTVRRCIGLPGGIYYYDPVGHRLVLVNADPVDRQSLFNVAGRATGMTARPDVLITMTSRFQRMSWKYRAIAYATILRHTGVLYQTMYLVATAMGLAPCGLGNGDADMSARVLGLDYLRESSVGDFILGSRQPEDSVAGEPDPAWQMLNDPEWSLPR